MKRTIHLLLTAIIAMVAASCATSYNYTDNNTHLMSVSSTAHTLPIVADLDIQSSKIDFKMIFKNNLSLREIADFNASPKVQYMIKLTLNKAAEKYAADVIVAPNYSISTSEDFRSITVTITGFPATYSNFRTATAADMEMIKNGNTSTSLVPCSAASIYDRSESEYFVK